MAHPKCGAKSRQHGGPCKMAAGFGTDHVGLGRCKYHGGSTPGHRTKHANEHLERETKRILASLDVVAIDDPLTEMSRLAGQVVAFKDRLAEMVNKLEGQIRYQDDKGSEQLRSEVALWERALDRCNTVLTAMAKLRIDERLAAISERQAEAVLAAIDAAFDAVGTPRDRRPDGKRAAARHLRVVS